ncbi:sphingosine-1-phosphate lyase isoform X1 [Phaseolus vulgaris]|uniref:sphingosine-1-phosphate lyase isoform X1 n=1 Tax=Phaseolus vulgaris TaxID=3885 RepID=UPI0035C9E8B7
MDSSSASISHFRLSANSFLSRYEPLALLLVPLLSLLIAHSLRSFLRRLSEKGLKATLLGFIMNAVKLVPGVKRYIDAEKQKVVDKLQSDSQSKRVGWNTELPSTGLGTSVLEKMREEKNNDPVWQGKCSGTVYVSNFGKILNSERLFLGCFGTVYIGGSESDGHFSVINEACSMFAHTNPLHLDVFKSVARFEAEVVAMTAALLGSKEISSGGQICGNMTSGGTESILLAVKSSRDYMKSKKGITRPEMIIPLSGHSAYDKAAQYFNIKLWRAPVDKNFKADVKAIRRHINKNTILIVGSAPGFPHGIIDPIEELGHLASSFGICFHVDLCLGGFVLPFARELGYPIPPFDFSVKGVSSISVDVHKYGLAPKGTSVVLYRNHEIRKNQFVAVTEWSGGLYVSPTIAGSRPGSLIAGAWAAMISLGKEGYLKNTKAIMEGSRRIRKGIEEIAELFIVGKPDMTIVALGSDVVDIFEVNDVMSSKGWHLNALQRPNSIHICVTLQHVPIVEDFLNDLKESVKTVKENPGPISGGLAPIYGAAGKMPDRGMVQELLVDYMDGTC